MKQKNLKTTNSNDNSVPSKAKSPTYRYSHIAFAIFVNLIVFSFGVYEYQIHNPADYYIYSFILHIGISVLMVKIFHRNSQKNKEMAENSNSAVVKVLSYFKDYISRSILAFLCLCLGMGYWSFIFRSTPQFTAHLISKCNEKAYPGYKVNPYTKKNFCLEASKNLISHNKFDKALTMLESACNIMEGKFCASGITIFYDHQVFRNDYPGFLLELAEKHAINSDYIGNEIYASLLSLNDEFEKATKVQIKAIEGYKNTGSYNEKKLSKMRDGLRKYRAERIPASFKKIENLD